MRVAVVHNPGSGGAQPTGSELLDAARAAGHEVDLRSVKDDDWVAALDDTVDLVAAAGGDGTVRDVCLALAGLHVPVAIVPMGTSNNVARSLGIPTDDPLASVDTWSTATRCRIDLPAVSIGDRRARFVESVGAGVIADLLVTTEGGPGGGPSGIDHGLSQLAALVAAAPVQPWEVRIDDEPLGAELLACEVANIAQVGPGVVVAPGADPGDGLVDVALLGPEVRSELVEHLLARARHTASRPPSFSVRRGHHVVLRPPPGCRVHVDDELDDPPGPVIDISIDGSTLDVLVPE